MRLPQAILVAFVLFAFCTLVAGFPREAKMDTVDNTDFVADMTFKSTPAHAVAFHNETGEVGHLDISGDQLTFSGNADESARLFFDYVLKPLVDAYIQARREKAGDCK